MITVPSPTEHPTISIAEAAELYGVSRATLYRNLDAVPHIRIGGKLRVPTAALLRQLGLLGPPDTEVA